MIVDGRINNFLKNDLALVERLARHLDLEKGRGIRKCWKHLAEHLGVEERIYNTFKCNFETSPTEKLLDYLNTQYSEEFTIGKLKDGLASIERRDVIEDVIEKYKKLGEWSALISSNFWKVKLVSQRIGRGNLVLSTEFIKYIRHHKELLREGQTLETSALETFNGGQ